VSSVHTGQKMGTPGGEKDGEKGQPFLNRGMGV